MRGAESLVHTLVKGGVDHCFANPGTSEMHFVAALDHIPGVRCILGLQENIVTGAADGFFRITEKPAATLLHCGPGLANGLANLHNARRARSGIVNIVGDQATYHRPFDAPLTADTEGWARGVSAWVRTTVKAELVGSDAAVAIQAARTHPGQIATLILPSDSSWNEGGVVGEPLSVPPPVALDPHQIKNAARILGEKKNVLLLLGGKGMHEEGQKLARRIEAATGCSVITETYNGRFQRGRGRMPLERIPYPGAAARAMLKPYGHIVLAGARSPVGFFAYPNQPSFHHAEGTELHVLARPEQNIVQALQALVDELGAPPAAIPDGGPRPELPSGAITPESFAAMIAALLPEQAIIVDESISFGRAYGPATQAAAPHDWLPLTGGAIGCGLPLATGAAVGARAMGQGDRRVISCQADGSGMYTVQALWTQAREKLPITTVIFANQKYGSLLGEYGNVGANAGPTAVNMLDLGNPSIDWVQLATSLGVEAAQARTIDVCADLMRQSFKRQAPFLIELLT